MLLQSSSGTVHIVPFNCILLLRGAGASALPLTDLAFAMLFLHMKRILESRYFLK